jgi:CubicO group peptidase (beta-lactamase class C family)
MTATMIATLVEEGKLKWETTISEIYPDLPMHEQWKGVRLEQLLTNSSGAPNDLTRDGLWDKLWRRQGTPTEQRRTLVEGVLKNAPEAEPGTRYIYSNAGFSIAGAMAETVTQTPWEDLMRQRLFGPLGMTSAGFGPPGKRGELDQPRGHRENGRPIEPGRDADNPAAIGPAGIVHCSIDDWAKYIALHLQAAEGKPRLIKAESFTKLHTPAKLTGSRTDYAMGWGTPKRAWARGDADNSTGRVLTHNGSNTLWFCVTWIAPEKDFAVLIACHKAGTEADRACDEAAQALIKVATEK